MKLKINNSRFYNFFIKTKPQIRWNIEGNSKNGVLFISNEQRLELLDYVRQQFLKISNVKIISFFHLSSQNKNIIAYSLKEDLEIELKKDIVSLIKQFILAKTNDYYNFELINFRISKINEFNFSMEKLRTIVREVLLNKQEVVLPVYPKYIRKKINNFFAGYTLIKHKTIGPIGERKIKISYKPEK